LVCESPFGTTGELRVQILCATNRLARQKKKNEISVVFKPSSPSTPFFQIFQHNQSKEEKGGSLG